jgi:geranylgeranyl diphosphate synthase type II
VHLGRLFQIVDDIMDEEGSLSSIGKTPHKDKEVDKLTSVKTFGLDGARARAKEEYLICKKIIKDIPNSEFLSDFTDLMYIRKS